MYGNYKVTLQRRAGQTFIQLYRIFKPTTTEIKDWKFIENNETRVKQVFKNKVNISNKGQANIFI